MCSCICSMQAQLREQRQTLWWWRFTTFTLWLCLSLWTRHTVNFRNESQRNWSSRHLICASGNCTAVNPLLSLVSSNFFWADKQIPSIRVKMLQCVQTSDIYIHVANMNGQKTFIFCLLPAHDSVFHLFFLLIHYFLSLPRSLSLDVSTMAPACWHR